MNKFAGTKTVTVGSCSRSLQIASPFYSIQLFLNVTQCINGEFMVVIACLNACTSRQLSVSAEVVGHGLYYKHCVERK
jgi:hypothetical protein